MQCANVVRADALNSLYLQGTTGAVVYRCQELVDGWEISSRKDVAF